MRRQFGFTLIELMVVVVVLGLLAAVAIPSYARYVRRSKTGESGGNLARIYQGQMTYFHAMSERGLATFVNAATLTPSSDPGSAKYAPNTSLWASNPEWSAIGFLLDSAHYYAYASPGLTTTSTTGNAFTAYAIGDLDADNINSTFSRVATLANGEVQSTNLAVTSELE